MPNPKKSRSRVGTRELRPGFAGEFTDWALQPDVTAFIPGGGGPDEVLLHAPSKCAGLQRIYLDKSGTRYWVGAYNYEDKDRLFYVDESADPVRARIIPVHKNLLASHGAEFFIQPYSYKLASATDVQSYVAIIINGIGPPLVLKDSRTYSVFARPFAVSGLLVRASSVADDATGGIPWENGKPILWAPQAIAIYQGQVVWGGYAMTDRSDLSRLDRRDNFICFSDPNRPHALATTSNVVSSIRIGDTLQEPVTALAVNSASLDSVGIKGQLVVFTTQRVVIFDGLPPISGNPVGVNFSSVAMAGVGCNAPRSVVQTPAGIMFLASDGLVYLIPTHSGSGPIPVSRKIEPILQGLSPRQQRQCSAVFDRGFYKLSYPETSATVSSGRVRFDTTQHIGGGADADMANRQVWADLRPILLGAETRSEGGGINWFGPMIGMEHFCMARADGVQDSGEIICGSSASGALFETSLEELVTDPRATDPTFALTTPIETAAISGPLDLGDAHVDKTVTAVSYGVSTDKPTVITSSIVIAGDVAGTEDGLSFTESVEPPGSVFADAAAPSTLDDVFDTAPWGSPDSQTLVTERPPSRLRGRVFRIELREAAANGAKMSYSDLSFRAIIANRRK